jgi:predicted TIM-barrel fold metal-dependent hydrolase
MNRRDFIAAASGGAASATIPGQVFAQADQAKKSDAPPSGTKLRTITLEEHFASPGFIAGPGREFTERLSKSGGVYARIAEQLQEVGDKRIAEMDAAGIDMQVLSLNSPGVEQADVAEQIAIARESNDFLADVVKKYPSALPALPPCRSRLPIRRPTNWIAESSRASRARSLTAIPAAAIWTISSFGRSWSAPKPSMFRSICIPRCRRSRSSMRFTAAFPRR